MFGITATSTSVIAIKLSTGPFITASSVAEHLSLSVEGMSVTFNDGNLAPFTDEAKVRKLYRLSGAGKEGSKGKRRRKDGSEEGSAAVDGVGRADRDPEKERKELEIAILGLMALRGAV